MGRKRMSDLRSGSFTPGVSLGFCNIFGAENVSGAVPLGGLPTAHNGKMQPVTTQWICDTREVSRYVIECEHGHRGKVFKACRKHFHEFRTKITFCPRCNAEDDHKCRNVIREVS